MQIVDRRRQAQHVETDEIGRHQSQRQPIKRVKTCEARLHEKAWRNRPFGQLPTIGMREHETAERKEQIHGEIARSRAFPEQILGMAVDDEKGGHAPYAVKQYEAFRGRLDHGMRLGLADGFKVHRQRALPRRGSPLPVTNCLTWRTSHIIMEY
ncbi:hypothetical protein AGR7C_Lc220032 [Agrobacterium deltaense Zutra 3/1]|uniref:Uncharacterized protein n=1 Tax=Agrobacterium deltaense Zutra 3/1 TaxID=1183427 RepID=A0A1S7RRZ6_9HYPH|nr:hypothetical protein AGR7C_Lc220032 [Agrobacterium deltaense Zutra 3/1]